MLKNYRGKSYLVFDRAAWPLSLAPALLVAGAALISLTGELAAQNAGQNSLQAQIQRYGCNLPQYATSVAACRELHARARGKKPGGAAPRRARQPFSSASTRAPAPPRSSTGGGFFASLFGGGTSSGRNSRTPRSSAYSSARPEGSIFGLNLWPGTYPARMQGSGRYRTLCVRSCDGYYWPVSFSTTRAGFSRDARQCASSCAVPAKLFVHRNPGADVEHMVDLGGQPYSRTENAFRYRAEYVKDCRCKPEPWSEAAKQDYATRVAAAEIPAPAKTATARRGNRPAAGSAPPHSPAARQQASNRKKAPWRVRYDEAENSDRWWAGSW